MRTVSLSELASRSLLRVPSRTVRLRLTLFYSGLFLFSGAALLATTYLLVRRATGPTVVIKNGKAGSQPISGAAAGQYLSNSRLPHNLPSYAQQARAQAVHDHAAELHQLLIQSGIALAIMTVASIALGWLVSGRVLRPLRTITATTRQISERNLHERLALGGPADELKDLADTVDGLLARLESAFGAQRRFVANAAHELRTPLTLLRALLEETLTDPSATIDSFRATSRRLLALGQEQERLIEALLTLASSERGLDHQEPFDLSVIVDTILLRPQPDIERLDLQIDASIEPAPITGDPALAERLVRNLIDNAIRHNIADGTVQVSTGTMNGQAFLTVINTGPIIPDGEAARLFEPFQRLAPDRTAQSNGHHGLGLSIVQAIATAHNATIAAHTQRDGGLSIMVSFPQSHESQEDTRANEPAAEQHHDPHVHSGVTPTAKRDTRVG
ncbi:MAG: HAMP domain-containing histidine kinase [Actinobacteria bacterium]|nr:HAMP domain-containing histidine kinase [Actinomycetota bacterium]